MLAAAAVLWFIADASFDRLAVSPPGVQNGIAAHAGLQITRALTGDIDLVLTGTDFLAAGIEQGLLIKMLPDPASKFPLNYFQPATSRAFDNFYAGRGGSWLYYARAWQMVARRFASEGAAGVVIADVDETGMRAVAEATGATAIRCDVTQSS